MANLFLIKGALGHVQSARTLIIEHAVNASYSAMRSEKDIAMHQELLAQAEGLLKLENLLGRVILEERLKAGAA